MAAGKFCFTAVAKRQIFDANVAAFSTLSRSRNPHGKKPITLGGDHSITAPICAALAKLNKPITLVQIDAHLDFVDEREASLSKLSALDGWGATSSEKVLDALETRAATPIPLAAFVFALGAPRIGKATAKKVAGICGSWAALRRCFDPTTAADDALRTALVEARGVGPAAVEGLLEFFAGVEDAAVADRLAARLDVVDDDT